VIFHEIINNKNVEFEVLFPLFSKERTFEKTYETIIKSLKIPNFFKERGFNSRKRLSE